MAFELFRAKSMEEMLRPSPEAFLAAHPRALRKLKSALRKIKFRFKGTFVVDLTMPNWVGGYFAESLNMIAINPFLLLYGSEKDIAHVLFHEGLHAGVYTNGVKVDDEALVESMTKKEMGSIYEGKAMATGYDSIVSDFNEYFGDMSFNELADMIEEGDDDTFNNLLEVMVVNPSVDSENVEDLNFEEIKKKLKGVWDTLQILFPRMMNKIANRNVGPHAGTNVELHHFELDGLLENAAKKMLSEHNDFVKMIFRSFAEELEGEHLTRENIVDQLFKNGLGYLYDTERDVIDEWINAVVTEVMEERAMEVINKIDVGKLKIQI